MEQRPARARELGIVPAAVLPAGGSGDTLVAVPHTPGPPPPGGTLATLVAGTLRAGLLALEIAHVRSDVGFWYSRTVATVTNQVTHRDQ